MGKGSELLSKVAPEPRFHKEVEEGDMSSLYSVQCHQSPLLRVRSSSPPPRVSRGRPSPHLPQVTRRHLADQPLSPGLPPSPCPSFPLHLSQPPPLSSSRSRLFSEPLNPSQASDIYSLESEYFLFLFPRASLLGEISLGFQPALPEVKCGGQSWLMSAWHQLCQPAIMRHPLCTRPFLEPPRSAHLRALRAGRYHLCTSGVPGREITGLGQVNNKSKITWQVRGGTGMKPHLAGSKVRFLPLCSAFKVRGRWGPKRQAAFGGTKNNLGYAAARQREQQE